jgi:ABC-type polysaccharide/polyol phosphate export permease
MKVFKELYQYRELLKTSIKKDIRGKYKGSFLGVLWSFVNPLLMVLVYAIVFPFILRVKEDNYLIFLIVGIIPWNFFTTSINQGVTSVLHNANIIKKVYFPREILPISVVTSGLVNFLISCLIIFIFLIFSGVGFSWYILLLPLIIFIQYILSLSIVFVLSAINVYIRDAE